MNSNESLQRTNNRAFNALRPIQYTTGIAPHALGSVLFSFGNTQVICACTIDNKVPTWMRAQGVEGGWMTA